MRFGKKIFEYSTNVQSSRAVRFRRDLLTESIDSLAAERHRLRILSVACGHLREARRSRAVRSGDVEEFVALDQDEKSLSVVDESVGQFGVRSVRAPVRSLISGKLKFDNMDFVYAAGLYDYLRDRTAVRLTGRLFSFLAPGGRLLLANFTPTLVDIGYMEAFMNWKLIYRTTEQMELLCKEIAVSSVASYETWSDESGAIAFMQIQRN